MERFKREYGLPWPEMSRRIEIYPYTIRRWWKKGVRPNAQHIMALRELAESQDSAICSPSRQRTGRDAIATMMRANKKGPHTSLSQKRCCDQLGSTMLITWASL